VGFSNCFDWNNNLTGMFSLWRVALAREFCFLVFLQIYLRCFFCICYCFVRLCGSTPFASSPRPNNPATQLKARGMFFFYIRWVFPSGHSSNRRAPPLVEPGIAVSTSDWFKLCACVCQVMLIDVLFFCIIFSFCPGSELKETPRCHSPLLLLKNEYKRIQTLPINTRPPPPQPVSCSAQKRRERRSQRRRAARVGFPVGSFAVAMTTRAGADAWKSKHVVMTVPSLRRIYN